MAKNTYILFPLIHVIHANVYLSEWKCEQDATRAAWLYKSELLSKYETRKAVVLQMDLRESIVDQQRSLISLYKAPKVEWAGPVSCKLEGIFSVL